MEDQSILEEDCESEEAESSASDQKSEASVKPQQMQNAK
jgi:hypothetical protein